MVFLTVVFCAKQLCTTPRKHLRRGFIDTLRIHVKGGPGGAGLPKYGGVGGRGGNVYVIAKEEVTLEQVKASWARKIKARPGGDSSCRGIVGMAGDDLHIPIPVGTSINTDTGIKLGELNKSGEKLLVARGGFGGCAETGYCGVKGEVKDIILDLKLIGDVGLVGFPNAGKSTFLNVISKAKPRIAPYPFTTIAPEIGTILYPDHRQIIVADLPGLIEGAHANLGKGHKFLKHLERTKVLLFIIDIQGFQLSPLHYHNTCMETLIILNREIELYKPDLLNMPAMLLVNKMDTENAENIYKEIKPQLENFSEYVSTREKDMQPTKLVKFDRIMTTSLRQKNPKELEDIKVSLRQIIDDNAERKYFANENNLTAQRKLLEQVERFRSVGTTLV